MYAAVGDAEVRLPLTLVYATNVPMVTPVSVVVLIGNAPTNNWDDTLEYHTVLVPGGVDDCGVYTVAIVVTLPDAVIDDAVVVPVTFNVDDKVSGVIIVDPVGVHT